MTFDPFGDFETRGYLRNIARVKDPKIVRQLEHTSFTTGLDAALASLSIEPQLSYRDVLDTHKVLFEAVYPWAGTDRLANAANIAVRKGSVLFAQPGFIQRATEHALKKGQDTAYMIAHPGEVMGLLAYAHPFLDGNGRTIMVIHSVMAQRAGFGINWAGTNKNDYLNALTEEIDDPRTKALDAYLRPFILSPIDENDIATALVGAPGLDGQSFDNVAGNVSDPDLQKQYRAQELVRNPEQG